MTAVLDFTPKQLSAIDNIEQWYCDPGSDRSYMLGGYAGTGKTTIIGHAVAELGVNVIYCAPTGKAASVLERKGCTDAMTLHRAMYQVLGETSRAEIQQLIALLRREDDPHERRALTRQLQQLRSPRFERSQRSILALADPRKSLVVVDESSMVGRRLGEDLMSFGIKVLAVGDPAQLPPVMSDPFFTGTPNFLLDEIHRSEADSPVTYFATQVRQTGRMQGRRGNCGVRYDFPCNIKTKSLLTFDQIITHTNARRHEINARIREHYGRDPRRPVKYDLVMCLRNNYDFGVLNGEQYHVLDVKDEGRHWLLTLQASGTDDQVVVPAAKQTFVDENDKPADLGAFTWGFATTAHKAQGSQWPRVLVFAERYSSGMPGWLYTAITRASERVVVIQAPR